MRGQSTKTVLLTGNFEKSLRNHYVLAKANCADFINSLPDREIFDLVVTSPPYNIGKEYESRGSLQEYLFQHRLLLRSITKRLKNTGSICWQVGNYISNGYIEPLDVLLHPIFRECGLKLRNRIIWHFGHGLHCKKRFSGRYEVVLWYTKSDDYYFDLDSVRIGSKYPGKRHYKGPNHGKYSGNPKGKNPEDVWCIPNVKGNHCEKTVHPCQFPVGLVERLVLALTKCGGLVFDPYCGVASAGIAAAVHHRRFWGCENKRKYLQVGRIRLNNALQGNLKYRRHDQPIYDHKRSNLSISPFVPKSRIG